MHIFLCEALRNPFAQLCEKKQTSNTQTKNQLNTETLKINLVFKHLNLKLPNKKTFKQKK